MMMMVMGKTFNALCQFHFRSASVKAPPSLSFDYELRFFLLPCAIPLSGGRYQVVVSRGLIYSVQSERRDTHSVTHAQRPQVIDRWTRDPKQTD